MEHDMSYLLKQWKYVLIAALAILLAFCLSIISQKNLEIKQIQTESKLEVTKLKADYVETARQLERKYHEQQIQALEDYKEREKVYLADASNANDAVNRLSDTINTISATAKLDAELRDRYIDTSNNILKECSREYSKMGQIADRLSNEVRLLSESNRR
jgi:glycyl-tRNA synthetase alpha subunit